MTTVRKAVIPAAGLGTRFLPASKSIPKEMLPIVDRPTIEYVVEEAVRAGIRDILVVNGRGKGPIEDHFDREPELEAALEQKGKQDLLKQVQALADLADLHFIRQHEPLGLGHAVSVARDHVGDESFAVLLGDDVMVDDAALLRSMIEIHDREQASVVALLEVEPDEISAYGCAEVDQLDGDVFRLLSVVEKPKPEDAPSNLAVIGRYVLRPGIFDALDRIEPGAGGELQLTDAIGLLLAEGTVLGRRFTHGRYDAGMKVDFLRANLELALDRTDLADDVEAMIVDVVRRRGLV
ncbi:MAG TPA: UTP--glucose-1-phosphate uridylyltransferase GalU [Acidimicrobiia bacterium]|nr:UTP--glucose-1-phosphate uridylyltransferase GalU [Acidimicrobiia bacterium]